MSINSTILHMLITARLLHVASPEYRKKKNSLNCSIHKTILLSDIRALFKAKRILSSEIV